MLNCFIASMCLYDYNIMIKKSSLLVSTFIAYKLAPKLPQFNQVPLIASA